MGKKNEFLSRDEAMKIPAPEFTDTWHPVSHGQVIQAMDKVVSEMGVGIREETYSAAFSGANLFGTWTLDMPMGDTSMVQLGFRNSTNKMFAVGICAGTHVIACSNLCFSGEFIEFRKHTSGMNEDALMQSAKTAMGVIVEKSEILFKWQESLREVIMSEDQFKVYTYDAITEGLIGVKSFIPFTNAFEEERKLAKKKMSLYQFYGAVTRLNRGNNLFTVSDRTNLLKDFLDSRM
jgi:hypothetical protein